MCLITSIAEEKHSGQSGPNIFRTLKASHAETPRKPRRASLLKSCGFLSKRPCPAMSTRPPRQPPPPGPHRPSRPAPARPRLLGPTSAGGMAASPGGPPWTRPSRGLPGTRGPGLRPPWPRRSPGRRAARWG